MFEIIALIAIIVLSFAIKLLFDRNRIAISNKTAFLVLKLIILSAGLILIYINLGQFHEYQQKRNWQVIRGEIVSFEIVGIKTREPEIGYRFQLNDDLYNGKTNLQTPLFGSRKYQEQTARTISGNYRVGDSVMVYYNPENPAQSALKIRPAWSLYIQFTFAVFVISIVLALIFPKKPQEEKQKL